MHLNFPAKFKEQRLYGVYLFLVLHTFRLTKQLQVSAIFGSNPCTQFQESDADPRLALHQNWLDHCWKRLVRDLRMALCPLICKCRQTWHECLKGLFRRDKSYVDCHQWKDQTVSMGTQESSNPIWPFCSLNRCWEVQHTAFLWIRDSD